MQGQSPKLTKKEKKTSEFLSVKGNGPQKMNGRSLDFYEDAHIQIYLSNFGQK